MKNEKKNYEKPLLIQHKPLNKVTKMSPMGMCESWTMYPGGWPGYCKEGMGC